MEPFEGSEEAKPPSGIFGYVYEFPGTHLHIRIYAYGIYEVLEMCTARLMAECVSTS